MDKKKKAIETK
jgi:hypothetical protein